MPIAIENIRDHLMPGLYQVGYGGWQDVPRQWESLFSGVFVPSKPHIWVPKMPLSVAVAAGMAAAVIENPIITRRFWSGWGRKLDFNDVNQ